MIYPSFHHDRVNSMGMFLNIHSSKQDIIVYMFEHLVVKGLQIMLLDTSQVV